MLWRISFPALLILFAFNNCYSQTEHEEAAESSAILIVRTIQIVGNSKTKDPIILRELQFGTQDTLSAADWDLLAKESKQSLLNTGLFNFVTITSVPLTDVYTDIIITVVERWYIWPAPEISIADPNFNTWWLTRDFSRLNYGGYLFHQNFRGRNERLFVRVNVGYADQYGISYRAPYINRKKTLGAAVAYKYQENIEVAYGTIGNKRLLFRLNNGHARTEHVGLSEIHLRPDLFSRHVLRLLFHHAIIPDSLANLSRSYFGNGMNYAQFFSLEYEFSVDRRDLQTYPLTGYLLRLTARQDGLGSSRANTINQGFVKAVVNTHQHLGGRFFAAAGITAKFSPNYTYAYYMQRGLGYEDFVRGYEYYVLDGQDLFLFKSNLKYQLVKPKLGELPVLGAPQFRNYHFSVYLNAFYDQGLMSDFAYALANPLVKQTLSGFGLGLDFVTYYDKVLRFEFSMNRQKESSFYIHFTQSI